MKTMTTAVRNVLASRQYFYCSLYIFTLVNGTRLLYTGADCDIKDPDTNAVYSCGHGVGPYFEIDGQKSTMHQKLGTDVDQMTLDILPGDGQVLGLPFLQAVRQRVFSGAQVQVLEAVAPNTSGAAWPFVVTGSFILFTGFVAEIDASATLITMKINSAMERLQSQWPRNLVAPTCCNVLGDVACGVTLSGYSVTGTVTAGSTSNSILSTLSQAASYFDLGTLKFTSGANQGLSMSVRSWAPGVASLMQPFPNVPGVGDTFTISQGCDLTDGPGGCAKFNNIPNFRGFPYVPPPTTAGA